MLEDRARRSEQSVSVEVDWVEEPCPVTPILTSREACDLWLASEESELQPHPPSFAERLGDGSAGTIAEYAADLSKAKSVLHGMGLGDNRTREQYLEEVAEYLAKARRALPGELRSRAVRRGLGRLDLVLRNITEHNFGEVEVVLRIEGAVLSSGGVTEGV